MFYQLKVAEEKDLNKLTAFANKAGVNSEGFPELIDQFILMEDGNHELVACIGIEPVNEDGILRSLVVSDKLKQAHILTLFQSAQTLSRQKGMKYLYLITNNKASIDFLIMMGFEEISTEEVPVHLLNTEHMRSCLVENDKIVMVKEA
ncbi:hypothetical protein [Metabacillus fastidiosus]|uniref:N-acetyltransferase domain-containing protein n=1 Tax=Metabacillus fastidiosus TaxID=1458 RepID=A0ABU6P3E5_9BACI|nr:hypothetical protein [Metabacillus fastidiosus]MED4403866.1 hypothetical protein [Metabacillus fastidiosus]MED4456042.1 hypothetical protein [Metabacillus fastidiosus]MED4464410.1 hypothetical protein [Metabacillus fastidiosus]